MGSEFFVLPFLTVFALCIWIFDLGRYLKNLLGIFSNTMYILIVVLVSMFGFVFFKTGEIKHNIGIFLIISFIYIISGFFFNIERKYIYFGALTTLILMPIFYFLDLLNIAENLGVLMFFLLVIGVIKDMFYDKIYK